MSVSLDNLESIDVRPIRRALISVYDKTNLLSLGKALHELGVEIVSTGSTGATLQKAGIPVTPVEEVTGFPECLEGRVKTLHPRIHAGILADQRKAAHREQLAELDIKAFDLVVCNLYPFVQTLTSGASFDECVEQIDIGGPSMLRAAAKNHPSVAVITSPSQYEYLLNAVEEGGFSLKQRRKLAAATFVETAIYDMAIGSWLAREASDYTSAELLDEACKYQLDETLLGNLYAAECSDDEEDFTDYDADLSVFGGHFPQCLALTYQKVDGAGLRYGENPHQQAALYAQLTMRDSQVVAVPGIASARQISGKDMSYNNYTDGDAALRAAYDHAEPCVAIIKHANPCGIAVAEDIAKAHSKAHACDPVSAFGGVIAANRQVTAQMAKQIVEVFTEVVIAPSYEPEALEILATKKNLRVLEVLPLDPPVLEVKEISGGLLLQDRDTLNAEGDDPANWQLVAGEAADAATLNDLAFAWRAVRAVRSNAILLAKDGASVGVGMGQVNRVDSCKLAVERANTLSSGAADAVAASDAFFPFADGLQVLIDAGVKAVVQPGGSIRDEESIAAAKAAGITMYLTGARHFAH